MQETLTKGGEFTFNVLNIDSEFLPLLDTSLCVIFIAPCSRVIVSASTLVLHLKSKMSHCHVVLYPSCALTQQY